MNYTLFEKNYHKACITLFHVVYILLQKLSKPYYKLSVINVICTQCLDNRTIKKDICLGKDVAPDLPRREVDFHGSLFEAVTVIVSTYS